MDTNLLKQFHDQEHMRDAVKQYMFTTLNELALEKVYKKQSTEGIADAKQAIEKAFTSLSSEYGKKPNKPYTNRAE